ncbi:MAG TPA: hypothetical protein VIL31_11795 [Cyclobacteriaceae bacterium]|jgi:hypothetical protein
MSLFASSQNIVYDSDGNKKRFSWEDLDIEYSDSQISFPQKKGPEVGGLLAILPTVVDIGFQLTGKMLENRLKKFSAEYTKQRSYLGAGGGRVPNFSLIRKIRLDGVEYDALKIDFSAEQVKDLNGFIYYVAGFSRLYSSAKAKKDANVFDYTIEIKVTLLVDGEKKVLELAPMVLTSMPGKPEAFKPANKHRTDIIPMPEGAVMTEVAIKVVETNPIKVRAEKILSLWNDNKDSVKTIINNFLPKEKEGGGSEEGGESNGDENTSVGNEK